MTNQTTRIPDDLMETLRELVMFAYIDPFGMALGQYKTGKLKLAEFKEAVRVANGEFLRMAKAITDATDEEDQRAEES